MTQLNELLKHTSRSLYLSARLLPPSIRNAFGIAYLLCRYADSIADTSLLPPEKRLYWISLFPQTVAQKNAKIVEPLVHEISSSAANKYEEELLHNLPACMAEFQKLPPAQQQATQQVVEAVCEGMKWLGKDGWIRVEEVLTPTEYEEPYPDFYMEIFDQHTCVISHDIYTINEINSYVRNTKARLVNNGIKNLVNESKLKESES